MGRGEERGAGDATDRREGKSQEFSGAGGGDGGGDGGGVSGGRDYGGGDGAGSEGGTGGDLDEIRRRCSMLDVSLRASRREALTARQARDAAESTVREQKEALASLGERVSELEASLAREKNAGKVQHTSNSTGRF